MTNVIPISIARPSAAQLQNYAETQARHLLASAGISLNDCSVTATFQPSAKTNLDAVSDWIYRLLINLGYLRAKTLDRDLLLRAKFRIAFFELLERAIHASPFD